MSAQGKVESAIRRAIPTGSTLRTPSRSKPFIVDTIDGDGVLLLLGKGQTRARLSWECLEGIPRFLKGRGWTEVGSKYEMEGEAGTLDGYLKDHIKVTTAGWVARVLEEAGVIELDYGRPLRVRLRAKSS